MVRSSYQVAAETSAAPAQVWSLLINAYSWPRWGTVDALLPEQSEQISPDGHDGVGAVRAFRTGRVVTREKIVEMYGNERLVYEGADNPFMNDYRAEISLTGGAGGGTAISWRGSYDVAFGLHFAFRPMLTRTMRRMVHGLAQAAARSATP
ncbi:SRPBCC family protein [Plantactinospora sp. CA-290183]|uniref:SRPBCC family protein n=1 Tax=Plantactinospora sp. CA-290183 TaxID=3240006 RepID=UPI003D921BFB